MCAIKYFFLAIFVFCLPKNGTQPRARARASALPLTDRRLAKYFSTLSCCVSRETTFMLLISSLFIVISHVTSTYMMVLTYEFYID